MNQLIPNPTPSLHRCLTSVIIGGALAASGASAATIASYDFASNTSSSDTETNTTAADFAANGGGALDAFGAAGRSGSSFSFFTRNGQTTLDHTNYVGFTVTIDAGQALNLTDLDFNYTANDANGTVAGESTTFSVRTSADAFASDLAGTYSTNPDLAGDSVADESASFDLTGASFQGLTGSFEVRIYSELTVSSFEFINRYDNVVLDGTVTAIPEPASFALVGMGSLALLRRRRRA